MVDNIMYWENVYGLQSPQLYAILKYLLRLFIVEKSANIWHS